MDELLKFLPAENSTIAKPSAGLSKYQMQRNIEEMAPVSELKFQPAPVINSVIVSLQCNLGQPMLQTDSRDTFTVNEHH